MQTTSTQLLPRADGLRNPPPPLLLEELDTKPPPIPGGLAAPTPPKGLAVELLGLPPRPPNPREAPPRNKLGVPDKDN